jgi:hypothetical protein
MDAYEMTLFYYGLTCNAITQSKWTTLQQIDY